MDERALRQRLLTAPVVPLILQQSWPVIAVLLLQTLVGIAETFYVSFLGTDQLAGVTLVFLIVMLMTILSNGGIGGGVSSAVARAIGAGRFADADALLLHAFVLAVMFGMTFTTSALRVGPMLYCALGGNGPVLDAALTYSKFLFIGAAPIWIVNLFAAALRGAGNVRTPAIVTFTGTVVLLILSPALIFGFCAGIW